MRESTRRDYEERMLRVMRHLEGNLDDPPSLDELAAIAAFSPYHFHRIFRGMTGESLKAYQRRLLLERAAGRLQQTDDSILQVAMEAGFESHAAFTRAFKAVTGLAPSAWRTAAAVNLRTDPGDLLARNRKEKAMDVTIIDEKEMRVAYVRHTGPYDQCGRAWETLCTRLGPEGRLGGGPRMIGLSYDDPDVTAPEALRYDACIEVDDEFVAGGPVGVKALPAGRFARTTHHGPYDRLSQTYAAFFGQWLPGSGFRCGEGPTRENYLNDPESTAPEDLVTDIFMPLENCLLEDGR